MMKRKIFEKFDTIKRKCVLCLMLAGLTAVNTGFTEQEEIPAVEEVAEIQIEETSANEPTAIAVGENGRLQVSADNELALAYAEIVEKTLGKDLTEAGDVPLEEAAAKISTVEEPVIETSQGYEDYVQVMDMEATAYLPTDGSAEGITAMGIPATYGIVAVDPDVIPLGSRVYIPGYGYAVAEDTGGAIVGHKIDVAFDTVAECYEFGRQFIDIYIID